MKKSMASYATMHYTKYNIYISWETAHSKAIKAGALAPGNAPPAPDLLQ